MNNFDDRNSISGGVIGNYIEVKNWKNKNLVAQDLLGVDVNKQLIIKNLNEKEGNLNALKVVEKGCFVMNGMHVARDKRMPVALYMGNKTVATSSSYYVFRVKSHSLLPYYLNLLFKTVKMDQMGLYLSEKDIRGKLKWKDFIKLPISFPPIKVQKRIVHKYKSLERIIQVKKEINDKLEKWMQSLFHVMFDDLKEFTNETFGSLFEIVKGGRPPRSNEYLDKLYFCKRGGIPWLQISDISKKKCKFIYESAEQLTEEGFKKSNCKMLGGGTSCLSITHKKSKLKT